MQHSNLCQIETIIQTEAEQLKLITGCKLSAIIPLLKIAEMQNKLNISKKSHLKKALAIVKRSMFNN